MHPTVAVRVRRCVSGFPRLPPGWCQRYPSCRPLLLCRHHSAGCWWWRTSVASPGGRGAVARAGLCARCRPARPGDARDVRGRRARGGRRGSGRAAELTVPAPGGRKQPFARPHPPEAGQALAGHAGDTRPGVHAASHTPARRARGAGDHRRRTAGFGASGENLAMVAARRLEPALAPRGFDVTQVIRVLVFDSEEGRAPLPFA